MALGGTLLIAVLAFGVHRFRTDEQGGPTPVALEGAAALDPHAVTNEVIAFFQTRVERDPVDFVSYTKLGEAYVRQARETGDISAYQRAETALRRALEIRPDDLDASAGLATVLLAQHDFAGALTVAKQVYAADPGATQALAIIGDASLALGDYDAAREAYGRLADVATGASVFSRLSHLAELRGDPNRAIELMQQAEEGAARKARSVEAVAFYRLQLGALHFNTGRSDEAEEWYAAALEIFPGYAPALAGLGNVEVARGNYERAIAYFERSVAVVPQPAVLAALGDVYARVGNDEAARKQYETVEFIGQLAEINRVVYNRELVLFYADHGIRTEKAVELALAELAVRKDIYGYDAAAWALHAAGRTAEAAPLAEQALSLGTQDARLLFHAGMIAYDLGHSREARSYLERALEINPHFSVLYEEAALRTLRALSDNDALAEAGD